MKSRITAAGMALLVLGGATFAGAGTAQAASKVTICHRTHSTTNPYRQITVSQSATVAAGKQRNHSDHTGPAFVPGYAYPPNAKIWGDIIPFSTSLPAGVTCAPLTATQFYNVEREAGQPHAAVVADLVEQEADADAAAGLTDFSVLTYTGTWSVEQLAAAERAVSGATAVPDTGTTPTTDPTQPSGGTTTGDGSPSGTDGSGTTTSDPTPTDPAPGDQQSTDPTPADPTPVDSGLPPETAPEDPTSSEPTPTDPPAESAPEGGTSADGSTNPVPADPTPTDSAPSDPTPADPTPTDPTPSDPSPTDPTPSGPTPTEPTPSDPTPVDPGDIPADSGSSEPPAGDPTPTDTAPPAVDPAPTDTPAGDPTPPVGSQRIDGTVWLDLNRNGRREPAEVGVPGARVQLFRVTPATVASVQVAGGAGTDGRLAAAFLATTMAEPVDVRVTDANGAFAFPDLPTGTYRVAAARPAALSVTFDGDDELDAASEMDLPADAHGVAHVGLVGDSTLDVRTVTADGEPLTDGDVVVRWAGLDGVLDTPDDVAIPATVVDGDVHVPGLPTGTYRIERTSEVLASASLELGAAGVPTGTVTLGGPAIDPVDPPATDPMDPPATDPVDPPATDPVDPPATDTIDPPSTDSDTGPVGTPTTPVTDPTNTPTTEPAGTSTGAADTIASRASAPVTAGGPLTTTATTTTTGLYPVTAAATAPRTLAATGSTSVGTFGAALGLVLAGGSLLAARRRLARG